MARWRRIFVKGLLMYSQIYKILGPIAAIKKIHLKACIQKLFSQIL